jgi:RNA polymerase sigma-70 factor (ECF subfamily)
MPIDRRAAFERAALPHLESVAFLAERLCGRAGADAEDLVQETFTRAWAAFDRFAPGTDAKAWLVTIALNAFRDRARRKGRDALSLDAAAFEPEAPPSPPPSSVPLDRFAEDRLLRALDALPEASRAVLTLAVVEGVPGPEIARALGIPEGTVRSLLSRAKAQLRRSLSSEGGPSRA